MDKWIRTKQVGDGTEEKPYSPKYSDQLDGYSAYKIGGSPIYAMHGYANESTLNDILSNSDAKEITLEKAVDLFNSSDGGSLESSGRPRTKEQLKNTIKIE